MLLVDEEIQGSDFAESDGNDEQMSDGENGSRHDGERGSDVGQDMQLASSVDDNVSSDSGKVTGLNMV